METIKNYCVLPENHDIIRYGKNVSHRPHLDQEIYKQHLSSHESVSYPVPAACVEYLRGIFQSKTKSEYKKAIRDVPCGEGAEEVVFDFLENIFKATFNFHYTNLEPTDGESTFNTLFVYPFLQAIATCLSDEISWCQAAFKPGEATLRAMTRQLSMFEIYQQDTHCYLADGIIMVNGMKNLEILVLETSNSFKSIDRPKQSFDHHKGLFGALPMLKSVVDESPLATIETFSQCKIVFIHASGNSIYMWSLRFEKNASMYELWFEDKLEIKEDLDDKLESLPSFLRFFWTLKCILNDIIETLRSRRRSTKEGLTRKLFEPHTDIEDISLKVNPSILKLTEEEDKVGMHALKPFFN